VEAIYQQRSSKRLPFYNEILIMIDSEQSITTVNTFNISQNGIGITSYLDIPVGTKILAHLVFDSVDCEVEGKIEWSSKNSGDNSFKMGVQLSKVTNEFNEIYQRINRKFNNPQTYTQSGTEYIHLVPKAEQIYSLST
jgi:hypothetical protein